MSWYNMLTWRKMDSVHFFSMSVLGFYGFFFPLFIQLQMNAGNLSVLKTEVVHYFIQWEKAICSEKAIEWFSRNLTEKHSARGSEKAHCILRRGQTAASSDCEPRFVKPQRDKWSRTSGAHTNLPHNTNPQASKTLQDLHIPHATGLLPCFTKPVEVFEVKKGKETDEKPGKSGWSAFLTLDRRRSHVPIWPQRDRSLYLLFKQQTTSEIWHALWKWAKNNNWAHGERGYRM